MTSRARSAAGEAFVRRDGLAVVRAGDSRGVVLLAGRVVDEVSDEEREVDGKAISAIVARITGAG